MNILFRAPDDLMARMRSDLTRHHPFAYERVGFVTVRAAQGCEHLVLLAEDYFPVEDEEYLRDPSVGAMMGQEAIRKALEIALLNPVGVFHVHMHGRGEDEEPRLWFSDIDLREQLRYVPDFFKVRREMPHGAIVLSPCSIAGRAWLAAEEIVPIAEFNEIGGQIKTIRSSADGSTGFYG